MSRDLNFGTERIGKLLIQQSVPAALGILVLSIYSLVDTVFIGQYVGGIGIAAITIVSPITFLVSSIGLGIGMGGSALISIRLGESDFDKSKQIVGNQSLLVLLFSIVILTLGFLFYVDILKGFGAHGESLVASQAYFYYTLLGLPFFMGQMMLNNVLRAEGNAKAAMLVLGVPALLNIGLDALFIAKLDMGLNGAALATAISQLFGTLLGLSILMKSSKIVPHFSDFRFNSKLITSIASLGSVQFFSQATMSIVVVIVNNLLMKYGGDLAISAYGLVLRIMMFAFFPVMGIVQGFMPIAGYNFGAGNIERVKEAIKKSLISSTVIAFGITLITVLFNSAIIKIFTTEEDLVQLASTAIIWFFSAYPLMGIQSVSTSYFQAIGKAKPALLLTLFKQSILVPSMFILPLWFGLDGIWYTLPITEVTTTVVAFYFFNKEIKSST